MNAGPRLVVSKIIRPRYYWPSMHKDAKSLTQRCETHQIHSPIPRKPKQEMISIMLAWPFLQWVIDIVGPLPMAPGGARAAVVAKVIPDAAMKLVHSDEMGVLVTRLVNASIIHGRYVAFKEVAELKEPFVLEKMPGYCPFLKEEYDRASDDMANASYPFFTELTADTYASME
nr:reverse transcriptase domain-containing protein [Tanacetum cinerariifolium]